MPIIRGCIPLNDVFGRSIGTPNFVDGRTHKGFNGDVHSLEFKQLGLVWQSLATAAATTSTIAAASVSVVSRTVVIQGVVGIWENKHLIHKAII
jgi:uncharacterized protein (DUF2062 family)